MLKKDLIIQISVNLALALNVLFKQSILSTMILFTIMVCEIGIFAHVIYMGLNDGQN